jgi:hypothetical protein
MVKLHHHQSIMQSCGDEVDITTGLAYDLTMIFLIIIASFIPTVFLVLTMIVLLSNFMVNQKFQKDCIAYYSFVVLIEGHV